MNYIPRREPDARRGALTKRIEELRHAVRAGGETRIADAAETVRAAALALIKAYRSKIKSDDGILQGRTGSRIDNLRRKLAKLEREFAEWSAMTVEEIVRRNVVTGG